MIGQTEGTAFSKRIANDTGVPELAAAQARPLQDTRACPGPAGELSEADERQWRLLPRTLLRLALPIALQSLISAAVNYADVWMLSAVDAEALSAVSLANQVTFVLTLFYLGLSSGLTILCAQYWGKGETAVIEKVLGACARLSLLLSGAFCLAMLFAPALLMRLFTPDPALIAYGTGYLRMMAPGCLPMAFSQMLLAALKSMEKTKAASWISALSLCVNLGLNALAIFVVFPGDPANCVLGVAAATVCSRVFEWAFSARALRRQTPARLRAPYLARTERWLWKDLCRCTVKVQLNYLVWGGALAATSALIGHVSTEMVSAYAVVSSVRSLATVACAGLSAGGGILLGKLLGAGRLALARRCGDRLVSWSLWLGAGAGALLLLLRPLCLSATALEPGALRLLSQMLALSAAWCVGKSYNSTLVGGVFCAGGDTGFGLGLDAAVMWGVILPLGCLCAFVWRWPPAWIFAVLCLDEFCKMPFVLWHYRKYRWVNDLTRKESA